MLVTTLEALLGRVASVAAQPAKVGAFAMTEDRLRAMAAIILALFGVVSGARAVRSTFDTAAHSTPRAPAFALLAGLGGALLGGVVLATAKGGLGTGHGFGGGIVALVLGMLALALGGWALTHSRRSSR